MFWLFRFFWIEVIFNIVTLEFWASSFWTISIEKRLDIPLKDLENISKRLEQECFLRHQMLNFSLLRINSREFFLVFEFRISTEC